MEKILSILLPVLQLLGVMLLALLLVVLLVLVVVWLVRFLLRIGVVQRYQSIVALHILVGYPRKHVWAKRLIPISSQNLIAMVGTAIGVWALIVVLSVMGGFESDLMGKIVRHSPHVMLKAPGENTDIWQGAETVLRSHRDVILAEAYVEGEGMVTSSTNMSPGMILRGIHPEKALAAHWLSKDTSPSALRSLQWPVLAMADRELGFMRPGQKVQEEQQEYMPQIPRRQDRKRKVMPGILLGSELAHSLSVLQGDVVTVVIPDGDVGPTGVRPRTRSFRVVGAFQSGIYEYDLRMAFLHIDDAQDLFFLDGPNRVAGILRSLDRLDLIAGQLEKSLDEEISVVTVAQVNRSLFSAMKIEKIAMFLVLGLVILVAGFNVFGSLTLITMEKRRDVAILQCLGATPVGVRHIFLGLGATIGLVGTVAGLILGLGSCLLIDIVGIRLPSEYYLQRLPVQINWIEIVLVALAAFGAAMLATIHPSMRVGRLSPVEGLRND